MSVLVIVHIGDHFPEYINTCISQIQSVSTIPIHLLISNSHATKLKHPVHVVPLESIPKSKKHEQFENTSRLDASFRNGFWKYAMLRFFYIYDYMANNCISDVFHIEYDNLIYVDPTKYLSVFQTRSMWCAMDSPNRCIPSFLYFKESSILSRVLDTCIVNASTNNNDMVALAQFRNNNPAEVGILPTVISYVDKIDPMYSEHAKDFTCLFDAAAVGQYIGGVDPRNISGNTVGFINETSIIKCNKMNIEWRDRKPFLNGLPLVNLHIHSKDLLRWTSVV
jgi:hypothetical protein